MSFSEIKFFFHPFNFIYFAIVIVFFSIVLFIILKSLRKATNRREERFKNKKTDSLISNSTKVVRKDNLKKKRAGLASIENQFTITKKIIIPSVVILGALVAVFPFLNKIPATIFSLFIGGFSIILGIAAKPLLENIFAGLVLSYSKSLNIGDTVLINEHYGTVEDITMSYTALKTWDMNRYIIPNLKMLQKEFTNLSLVEKYQWSYVEFFVSYDSDVEMVKEIAIKCANETKHTIEDNIPDFWVMEMKDNCYKCWIASWTENPMEAWSFKSILRTELIKEFKKNKIRAHSTNYLKNELDELK